MHQPPRGCCDHAAPSFVQAMALPDVTTTGPAGPAARSPPVSHSIRPGTRWKSVPSLDLHTKSGQFRSGSSCWRADRVHDAARHHDAIHREVLAAAGWHLDLDALPRLAAVGRAPRVRVRGARHAARLTDRDERTGHAHEVVHRSRPGVARRRVRRSSSCRRPRAHRCRPRPSHDDPTAKVRPFAVATRCDVEGLRNARPAQIGDADRRRRRAHDGDADARSSGGARFRPPRPRSPRRMRRRARGRACSRCVRTRAVTECERVVDGGHRHREVVERVPELVSLHRRPPTRCACGRGLDAASPSPSRSRSP